MTQTKRNNIKIAQLGGDLRQLSCADELEKCGYECHLYGFDTYRKCSELDTAMENADAVLLPVPVMRGEKINMPLSDIKMSESELFSIIKDSKCKLVIGGKLSTQLRERLRSANISFFDLCDDETFNYLNAVPTAEGAIALAINHTPIALNESHCAIIGYGRIGRCLSRRLKALGASVTVAARKERDRAEAKSEGVNAITITALPLYAESFDCVFNTVPEKIIGDIFLNAMKKDAPIIELASKPGGIDTVAAIRAESRIISAQSLPGRVAPVSAGRIIASCVKSYVCGEEQQ